MKRLIILLFAIFTTANPVLSQSTNKLVKQANKLFQDGKFDQAFKVCEVVLIDDGKDATTIGNKASAAWITSWIYKESNYAGKNLQKALEYNNKATLYYQDLLKNYPNLKGYFGGYIEKLQEERTEITKINTSTLSEVVIDQNNSDKLDAISQKQTMDVAIENDKVTDAESKTDKTVTIVVSGQGKTQDEARQNALRSAIEQAFGTFISSKTEILNDNLVKDEIVSVANGNIQKFDIISEVQIPDGGHATSLKATVSIENLTKFIESKGSVADIKGGVFSYNVKKEEFYDKSEFTAIKDFLNTRIYGNIFYDYTLLTHPPKAEGDNYSIELEIGIKANNNLYVFFADFFELLRNLSLTKSTVNFRNQSNLPVFSVEIKDESTYFLRNQKSFELIKNIERILFLKTADFKIETNPQFNMPSSDLLIKSNVVANNFILFNRSESPNPGVYWSWLPFEYNSGKDHNDQWTRRGKNTMLLTIEYLKNIPKQSELNSYSGHMSPVINNGRTDYNIVLLKKILLPRIDFEKLESVEVKPILNNYE